MVVSAHVGNGCLTSNKYGIWKEKTQQEECGVEDEATQLIDSLPEGTIDGFLQGHRHKFAHHFKKGTLCLMKVFLIWEPSMGVSTSMCFT